MKHFFLLAALLGAASPAWAQVDDHLTPPDDALLHPAAAAYRASVGRKLKVKLAHSLLVQVVVFPSFKPEYLLSVEQTSLVQYTLTYRLAQQSIWEASQPKMPANVTFLNQYGAPVAPPKPRAAPDSIPLTTYQVELQPRLAQALADLFTVALAQTHYANDHTIRIDGTQFTFSARDSFASYRSGESWSPTPNSNMGRLVEIVAGLQELATNPANREFAQGVLFSEAQDLLFDLAKR